MSYTDGLGNAISFSEVLNIYNGKRILRLTVKEPWFTLEVTREKKMEFRTPSDWIKSRLFAKDGSSREYDYIHIANGYGDHRPAVLYKWEGFGTGYNNHYKYSNGSEITPASEDYAIFLGEIVLKANLK